MVRCLSLLIAALLLATPLHSGKPPAINADILLEFNHHYALFFRHYFGCPLDGRWSVDVCHIDRGVIDLEQFRLAREDAKSLFGLN